MDTRIKHIYAKVAAPLRGIGSRTVSSTRADRHIRVSACSNARVPYRDAIRHFYLVIADLLSFIDGYNRDGRSAAIVPDAALNGYGRSVRLLLSFFDIRQIRHLGCDELGLIDRSDFCRQLLSSPHTLTWRRCQSQPEKL